MNLLPLSGSQRKYYRLNGENNTAIAAINPDERENRAFLYLSRHFRSLGLPVPEVYAEDQEHGLYLLEDLGDLSLYQHLETDRQGQTPSAKTKEYYEKAVQWLPAFQVKGSRGLDFGICYPRAAFDEQSMRWDLNYFKYYFLKLAAISFDEQALEEDFERFIMLLKKTDSDYFLYRDFQSRNIMIREDETYFIDYQGGRRGALQYDLVSLLFDAKADLPPAFRDELTESYLRALNTHLKFDRRSFMDNFYPFVYIRIMQAMGAYGFRGFYERKEHFLKSIPFALKNLGWLLNNAPLGTSFKTLTAALEAVTNSAYLGTFGKQKLRVVIRSFSYKRGIPADDSGHGGGFVFDCRALVNPGRFEEYQALTGLDEAVIKYLQEYPEVEDFLEQAFTMVSRSIEIYKQRGFSSLMVSFGCTGGQHRSVYLAESLYALLKNSFPELETDLRHLELANLRSQEK